MQLDQGPMTSNRSRSDLFQEAFGNQAAKEEAAQGKPQGPDARGKLFSDAFGQPTKQDLPEPHLGQSWRLDMTKVARLSFTEQYALSEYEGTPFRALPAWVRDGKFAIPSQDEAKHQKAAFAETGLTQSERNRVFNAAQADAEALAEMTKSELLRDSAVLDGEINAMQARYGNELLEMLNGVDPEAASYINARQKTQAAEAKVVAQSVDEAAIRAEIQAAQQAIAQMGGGNPLIADAQLRGSEVN